MEPQVIQPGVEVGAGESPSRTTLLVVDDDEHVRRALRRVLRRTRCRVVDAPDASTALSILSSEPVQVVVSDYRMPGMSGVEFLREVKNRWPRIQRVLLTGQADSSAIEEAVNKSEIFRFIWKPWDDAHLLITVQSAVDQFWTVDENTRLQALIAQRNQELERLNRDLDGKLVARSAALVRAAEEWRACFDAIGDPLAIVKAGGCEVLRANMAFARAARVPLTMLAGLRCAEHAYGELPCPSRCLVPAPGVEREATFRDRTWVVRSFPFEEDGAFVVVFKDVTDEREVTQRLSHAEKMAAVGQLAGGVAHEINNPLGGILAFAQLMSREDRSAEDAENLQLIQDAAMRAKRIVESLLRFSRCPGVTDRRRVRGVARHTHTARRVCENTKRGLCDTRRHRAVEYTGRYGAGNTLVQRRRRPGRQCTTGSREHRAGPVGCQTVGAGAVPSRLPRWCAVLRRPARGAGAGACAASKKRPDSRDGL
jgi:two-component system NtrC family sensor kinase